MIAFIRLLRLKHWVKNTFVFLPVFFAGELFSNDKFYECVAGFIIFSFSASAIYALNDIFDVEEDRQHPDKRNRPIAAGKISVKSAILIAVVLFVISVGTAYYLDFFFFICIVLYIALNLAYSFGLKNIAILDLFIVAFGFLLRVIAGGEISEVPVSHWLLIMVLLLSLFLVLAKRRDDLILVENGTKNIRKASSGYNLDFTNACLTLLSAVMIVSYIMYTVSDEVQERYDSKYLFLTCIFVIAGLMRYLQITMVEKKSGSPVKILYKDAFIFVVLLAWVLSFYILLYA
ncbi:decaprenyl-phosphate phosphoribosyltransferase [Marivirga harenae]|uniref:decaprenyl-phosphate phosphoribosyltransferase n=1 Tax=Marivirga harenae TaxID=2010992 RepID=UPI0026DFEFE4|nr:decaprenyl-phosphate phosphoribosyltransferase [Marivirga harenae]WKV12882.1 decaprenyl-phosphate phosphoribosyltransferase [Marivirga harenae]